MYAIVETGGKQLKVAEGDLLKVEKLDGNVGDSFVLDKVLMVNTGSDLKVGSPYVEAAKIETEIEDQGRRRKVTVFKYRRRKGYKRLKGHRQSFTALRVKKISV